MKRVFFIITPLLLLFQSCKNDFEPSDSMRLVGLWQRVSLVTVTAGYPMPDTVYENFEMKMMHFFGSTGDYVEYTFNDLYKDFYMKGSYIRDGDDLTITTENGASREFGISFKGDKLWLSKSKNSHQVVYYLLNKVI